jgi:hypothetical protein
MAGARIEGLSSFVYDTVTPLNRALSASLRAYTYHLERGINQTIKDNFYVPDDPSRFSIISFKQRKGLVSSAELSYRYKAIPLSKYPVKQYRITVGKKILSVKRGAGQTSGKAFKRQIVTNRAEIRTDVKVRKNSPWKLVKGTLGFKGWLHTGNKASRLAANIYERNQQATWAEGVRQPIHRLFGPSVSELTLTKEVTDYLTKEFQSSTLDTILYRTL